MRLAHAVRHALAHDPPRLAELLLGRTPLELWRLRLAVPWLPERVADRLGPPERDEVLAALRYDLPLATALRLARVEGPEREHTLRTVPPWVIDELAWLLREEPDSAEARLLRYRRSSASISASRAEPGPTPA